MGVEVKSVIDLWPLFTAMLALVVWLVRLEGRLDYVTKGRDETQNEVEHLRSKHEALDSKIAQEFSEVKSALARIEGVLSVNRNSSN